MSIFTPRRWAFEEMLRGLVRDFSRNAFALLLAALALSIPLFIAIVLQGLAEPLRELPDTVELTVFMKDDAKPAALEASVRKMPWVAGTRLIARDDALKELNARLGLPTEASGANPLPDILVVTLSPDTAPEDVASTAKAIEALPAADFVPYEASWHEKLRAVSHAAETGLACLGAAATLLVLLVLETAIRMTTLAARSEMSTLYLLGASPAFAVRPYAWRGLVLMGLASAAALGIARLGILVLQPSLTAAASLYGGAVTLCLPSAELCAAFVGATAFAGSLIAAFAAFSVWRTVRQQIRR